MNAKMRALLNKAKGKSVGTKFEIPAIVRQPNAFRFQKSSVLGKPSPFADSPKKQLFPKSRFVPKINEKNRTNHSIHRRLWMHKAHDRFRNDQFAPILGYGYLVQGNVTIKRVYYIEGLNHTLFSVGIIFTHSNLFHGKSSSTQAWLWHRRLSHLNFDTINLLSKNDIVNSLPKSKYVKDQLYSSCEIGKAKRSTFKTKIVPSSKGRLHLLHMDLCGPMRDETPEVLNDFLKMIQQSLQAPVINIRTDKVRDGENLDKMKEKGDPCIFSRYATKLKGYRVYNQRTRMIVESIHINIDERKEVMTSDDNTSGLVPQQQMAFDQNSSTLAQQQQKASDYDNFGPHINYKKCILQQTRQTHHNKS
ncbi:retrovirus-related pol polyprotein from transposon TNT 1-94 [Tanacetum coccineum]